VLGDLLAEFVGGFLSSGWGPPRYPTRRERRAVLLLGLGLLAGAFWAWTASGLFLAVVLGVLGALLVLATVAGFVLERTLGRSRP